MAQDPREQAEETARIVEDAFRSIAGNVNDIFRQGLSSVDDYGKQIARDVKNELNSVARSQSQLISNADKLKAGQLSSKEIAKQKLKIQEQVESIGRKIELAASRMPAHEAALLREKHNQLTASQDITEELEKQLKISKETEKLSKNYIELSEAIKDIPGLRKLAGPFESMAKGAKQTAADLATGSKTAGTFGKGISVANGAMKGFGKGLKGSMLGKAGWIGLAIKLGQVLFDAFNAANKQAVELSRNLGLNRLEAENFKDIFDGLSQGFDDSVATSANLQKSFLVSNKVLGFNLQTSLALNDSEKERLTQVNDINERLGLSEQSFSNLLNLSRITGESEEGILNTINSTVYQVGLQNKMMFNTKEILEEVLQTSDSIALQFSFNVREIAKATAEAKLLGFSLKDIEGTQSNMLNFESSIAAELEAEILTNKELNLERARAFALQGDLLSLGKELSREIGTFGEFQRMNILQQKALSKAVGMSREELTNVFKEQEKVQSIQKLMADEKFREYAAEQLKAKGIKNITEEAIEGFVKSGELNAKYSKVLGLSLTESLKRETATKRFERLMDKLKETLSRLASSRGIDILVDYIEKIAFSLAGGRGLGKLLFFGADDASVEKGRSILTPQDKLDNAINDASTVRVNDFTLETNPNDKIGGVLDNDSVNRMVSLLENISNQLATDRNIYMDGRLVGDAIEARSFK